MSIELGPCSLADEELEISFIRAQGAGGQNVNKVSSAVHLRFDINSSSLPDRVKERLLALRDQRISSDGVVVIKAQRFRTQDLNRDDAVARLAEMVAAVGAEPVEQRATKPTRASRQRRLEGKKLRGQVKAMRGKIGD